MRTWYEFKFADGYKFQGCGMSADEKRAEERKHGKLISKTKV